MIGEFLFDVFMPCVVAAGIGAGFVAAALIVRTIWRWTRS